MTKKSREHRCSNGERAMRNPQRPSGPASVRSPEPSAANGQGQPAWHQDDVTRSRHDRAHHRHTSFRGTVCCRQEPHRFPQINRGKQKARLILRTLEHNAASSVAGLSCPTAITLSFLTDQANRRLTPMDPVDQIAHQIARPDISSNTVDSANFILLRSMRRRPLVKFVQTRIDSFS